jgi:hypothetical protein
MIASGSITAFYLFDVGDSIALRAIADHVGATVPTRFSSKPPAPAYVQYREAPVVIDGSSIGLDRVDAYELRFKAFDYGVLSVALSRPMPGTWEELMSEALTLHDNPDLARSAEAGLQAVSEQDWARRRAHAHRAALRRLRRVRHQSIERTSPCRHRARTAWGHHCPDAARRAFAR